MIIFIIDNILSIRNKIRSQGPPKPPQNPHLFAKAKSLYSNSRLDPPSIQHGREVRAPRVQVGRGFYYSRGWGEGNF